MDLSYFMNKGFYADGYSFRSLFSEIKNYAFVAIN